MKIVISIDNYYPNVNGSSYFAQRLAYYLMQRGHEVLAIVPSLSVRHETFVHDGVEAFGVRSFPILFYKGFRFVQPLGIEKTIERRVLEFKPDLIHLQDHFFIGSALRRIAKKHGIPMMGTNHFMPENLTHYLHLPKTIDRRVKNWAWDGFREVFEDLHFITTPTQSAANLLKDVRLSKSVMPVSNGIDLRKFHPKNNGAHLKRLYNLPDKPIFLYVGRLDKEKNVDLILRALKNALKHVDIHFVIGGKGAEAKKLIKLAHALGISDHVTFTGFISDAELPNVYTIADAFVIAGIAELQSIVTMEAMASGLPVIAVNAVALPELVKHGDNGFLFDVGDVDALSGHLVKIFSDPQLRTQMAKRSLEIIQDHSIDRTISTYESLYNQLVKKQQINS
jgi:1,2-diacylglycerol 3-alpha-glucosyltransferase